jgi:hypothetical protein
MHSPENIAKRNNRIGLCSLASAYEADSVTNPQSDLRAIGGFLFLVCSPKSNQQRVKFPRVKLIQPGRGDSLLCDDKVAQKRNYEARTEMSGPFLFGRIG